MKSAVIVFPGSNCDRDVKVALAASAGADPLMVWHRETEFPKVDLIVVPGGFSYGDYLRAGSMAANSPAMVETVARANAGVPVLGICNGFQILCESGLLPGALMRNAGLRFVCHDVWLRVGTSDSFFTQGYQQDQIVRIPIAHHDGNYVADDATLAALEEDGRIAFRYCDETGAVTEESNPNGSANNIAGILSDSRTVLGMMPHPERLADRDLGGTDGQALFDTLVDTLAA
ncbi:MAG: phosphoribosylformylglycinamidine synthase subunit PurQ [Rhodospirillaceae bacterium]|jgi:phosphoribosylformylglycinamidine synthase subunit PurQ / glutaminase|nr:phosphoribosylformylglycinamidine synthase subunit PurQ [Rhodospirillaceae bacterium]MBT5457589.1 phosphoribosylformylglycinamidine synthase subunit PurQ [Rhodospirillaceae bacterium]